MCLEEVFPLDEKKTAVIFNIQRFSVFDGPGVRTAVFFKGCNLRCLWCHNPESYERRPQLAFDRQKCIGCGSCIRNCPGLCLLPDPEAGLLYRREDCLDCGKCARGCYAKALSRIGCEMTAGELLEDLLEDMPYYQESGGGVTFSGGECMLRPDFLEVMLRRLKEKDVHTAVDTAGNVPYESFERILPYTDLFLYDVKAFHEEVHRELTGASNRRIKENLLRLAGTGKEIKIRIPVIEELNAGELPFIRDFLWENGIRDVELLGYHRMGVGKAELLLEPLAQKAFREVDGESLKKYQQMFG
jgi:pyruvate formate lyase activating enzyme